ncbi:MAG: phosphoribosylformylglycinamidine synthase subunit PurS [Nitrospirae bacterium]|nr:phosphoribosylformylglycinamidine synthase subunit PurS [Nitrospirota bacterium]
MKAKVTVTFKHGVLEPQGKAILHALHNLGYAGVDNVRVGKLIEMDLNGADPDKAKKDLEAMCQELLANPVIENYAIEIA